MKISSRISAEAHVSVMKAIRPGQREYSLSSLFVQVCSACDLQRQAYLPIVGVGYNSAILHYTSISDEILQSGCDNICDDAELLLIDAAGEYLGYGSDITRTFPVNGQFSPKQKQIYEMVLRTQESVIEECIVGTPWSTLQNKVYSLICDEVVAAGFTTLPIPYAACKENITFARSISNVFCPHGFGHLVGIDVHDGSIIPTQLAHNMLITVEPGIYFNNVSFALAESNPMVKDVIKFELIKSEFLDISFGGIRIEDVVLIRDSSAPEVISSAAPKTISDIEKLMKAK
eukprot:TRINITY_DN20513_c0_g1_i1.p1 TRINITY_DN20513_c0_g1~~TRINITY_DN20513_c0_g1_i1.p1  ORF type:complete len:288 (+),score=38.80 TRINITY_DN20513_c0_g1_i1:1171-2034(+)